MKHPNSVKIPLCLTLAFSLSPFAFLLLAGAGSSTKPNDIRIQQYDGLHWNWIELRPVDNSALTFDGSLQFEVETNLVTEGYLSLSGQTNRLTIEDDTLKLDGEEIGGGGGAQTPWTSDINSAGFHLTNAGGILIGTVASYPTNYGTTTNIFGVGNFALNNTPGESLTLVDAIDIYGFGNIPFRRVSVTNCNDLYGFGNSSFWAASITDSDQLYAWGLATFDSALFNDSSEIYGSGDVGKGSSIFNDAQYVYLSGSDVANAAIVDESQQIFGSGHGALSSSILSGALEVYAYGHEAAKGLLTTNSQQIYAVGQGALSDAVLEDGSADVYAIGKNAGAGLSGTRTNVFMIGTDAAVTGNNQMDFGAGYSYRFRGPVTHGTNTYTGSIAVAPADEETVVGWMPITNGVARYYVPLYQ